MQRIIVALLLAVTVTAAERTPGPVPDGMPFGPVEEADVDRLAEFAKKSGFDLKPEMERVYKKDEEALARLFKFSLSFTTLDANARTYGQIVCSSLLNLGEPIGVDAYVRVLDRQPPEVQQRVRDFLYYPMLRVPKEQRKQVEEENNRMYPTLFPRGFHFAHDDPVFAKET
jgi:hypothetical protein